MATVYLACDLKHGRPVGLKVLRPELGAVLGAERFLREIRLTANLQHPHILPLLDSGEAAGQFFYVMPYVEGESLRARLQREGQLPLDEALRLTREVAEALDYAHQQGIVHRDIKPENILLSREHALVADFGIALAVTQAGGGRLTETGLSLGTPAYMSPEQAMAEPRLDGRSDQYSLACVLYEMLTGEPPYTGSTAQAIIAKRLSEPVPRLSTLRQAPTEVEAAVTRALAKSPADRFHTAAAFASALDLTGRRRGRPLLSRRAGALTTALAVLITGGLVGLGRRHAPSAGLDSRRVAVAVFENRTGEQRLDALGLTVADYVSRALLKTGLVSVGDIGALYVRGRDADGRPRDARELARQVGASRAIVGSYTSVGDSVEFSAAVIDVATGSLRQSFEPVRASLYNPMTGLVPLQQRVAAGLATVIDPRFSTFASQVATPPTYEAYRAFAEGQERFWWFGPDSTTLALFRRATTADPSFLTAAVWLAFASAAPLRTCPITDSLIRALTPIREQLDPLDRLNLDWSGAYCRGAAEEMYRIALASARLQPSSGYAKYWVALWAYVSNRPGETIRILTGLDRSRDLAWLPDSSKFLYYRDVTRAYHMLGDHTRELAAAAEYGSREPGRLPSLYLRARALVGLGRTADVLALIDSARHLPDDPMLWEAGSDRADELAAALAAELDFHGYREAGHAAAQLAVDYYRERPDSLRPAGQSPSRWSYSGVVPRVVWAALYVGEQGEAHRLLETPRAWSLHEAEWVGIAGRVALAQGDTLVAKGIEDSLARSAWPYEWGRNVFERATLAAYRGDREQAVVLLRQWRAAGMAWTMAFHYWPGLASLRGYAPFEALLKVDR
jgi:hypothetical protein